MKELKTSAGSFQIFPDGQIILNRVYSELESLIEQEANIIGVLLDEGYRISNTEIKVLGGKISSNNLMFYDPEEMAIMGKKSKERMTEPNRFLLKIYLKSKRKHGI